MTTTIAQIYSREYAEDAPWVMKRKSDGRFTGSDDWLSVDLDELVKIETDAYSCYLPLQWLRGSSSAAAEKTSLFSLYVLKLMAAAQQKKTDGTPLIEQGKLIKITTALAKFLLEEPKRVVFLQALVSYAYLIDAPVDWEKVFDKTFPVHEDLSEDKETKPLKATSDERSKPTSDERLKLIQVELDALFGKDASANAGPQTATRMANFLQAKALQSGDPHYLTVLEHFSKLSGSQSPTKDREISHRHPHRGEGSILHSSHSLHL